uniref:uncharacterized protein LOC112505627 n=1 Tax=Cynara cardunculus var. scolymus TaxID=59895 RepID=UPI000D627C86
MAALIKQDCAPSIIVFYDIESMQQSQDPNKALHVPNLLISSTLCDKCFDYTTMKRSDDCEICGTQYQKFYGETCIKNFCDYIYNDISSKARAAGAGVRIIAHNQKGYDGHFILRDFFVREFQVVPEIIMQGSKLLYIRMQNLRFIDSLSLLQQPLSALCKSFNIPEMKKGFFPHYFNIPANQDYDGPIPDIEYYGADEMKPAMRNDFITWYEKEKLLNKDFNFKKELEEYCLSDVNILTTAMMKFISQFRNITMLNPITRRFTLASVAMETFRARLLQPRTLNITPIKGYTSRLQSMSASVWLDYQR